MASRAWLVRKDGLSAADTAWLASFWRTHNDISLPEPEAYPPGALLMMEDLRQLREQTNLVILALAPQSYESTELLIANHDHLKERFSAEEMRMRRKEQLISAAEVYLEARMQLPPAVEHNILKLERIGIFTEHFNKGAMINHAKTFPLADPAAPHKLSGVATTGSGSDVWYKIGEPLLDFYKRLEQAANMPSPPPQSLLLDKFLEQLCSDGDAVAVALARGDPVNLTELLELKSKIEWMQNIPTFP